MRKACNRITSLSGFVGLCLVAVGLLANPWLLSHISGVGIVTLQGKILLVFFEVFIVVGGLLVFFKGNTPTGRKHVAFGLVTVLLVILAIEGCLHLINLVVRIPDLERNPYAGLSLRSPYQGEEWAETYFELLGDLRRPYEQYVGWQASEFHSEYINVDSGGVRKTWNPEHHTGELPATIYVFGGSTVWGLGARDDFTIPSRLSKLLHDDGHSFVVHNYGEMGYTFTQEIVRLTLLLREGDRPDYVVFYDGIADVQTACQSGIPGTTYRLSSIRETLRAGQDKPSPGLVWDTISTLFTRHSMIYRAIDRLADNASAQWQPCDVASDYSDEDLQLLAVGIAEYYLNSMEALDRLAEAYNFEYVCFWQPITCMEAKVTDEEAEYALRRDTEIGKLCRMTADHLAAGSPPLFFDISHALGERTSTYYIDWSHLSEEGNEVVAARIFEIFKNLFLRE